MAHTKPSQLCVRLPITINDALMGMSNRPKTTDSKQTRKDTDITRPDTTTQHKSCKALTKDRQGNLHKKTITACCCTRTRLCSARLHPAQHRHTPWPPSTSL
ncbi:unnamed protein product [Linum tenue]|uniref:Uncharacterized protein n=1 Tax=Linum tenue TaxID=586396 RepID=A0AAV0JAL4_9ROSI|nr:unnamed protein product [Linum tenue]